MTAILRILGGPDSAEHRVRCRPLLAAVLLLAPFVVLARFGGFSMDARTVGFLDGFLGLGAVLVAAQWVAALVAAPRKAAFLGEWRGWSAMTVVAVLVAADALVFGGREAAAEIAAAWLATVGAHRGFQGLLRSRLFLGRSALALVATFGFIIAFGTLVLFEAPRAVEPGHELTLIDALFTATSATCVTGLEVRTTCETFTPFGQFVVLMLIQLGGLGIMTLGTLLVITAGHRLGLSDRALVKETLNVDDVGGLVRFVFAIFLYTVIFEAIGAVLLLPYFREQGRPVFEAVFHSVSAFCNAGFALDTGSFQRFSGEVGFNAIVVGLIVVGGLGFAAVHELGGRCAAQLLGRRRRMLSLHTRLVVLSSAVLIVAGAVAFWVSERRGVLEERPAAEAVCVTVFQSVSARTAGFSTVPFSGESEALTPATRFLLLPLMLVGASPGSTGGGMKTITMVVLLLALVSVFRDRVHVETMGRSIPDDIVKRAGVIAVLYGFTVFAGVLALIVSDGEAFELGDLIFEAVSAVATVGFSAGVSTSENFSDFGKLVLTGLMFAGRLGPLTLVLITSRKGVPTASIEFPEERVMIG